jgi:transcriptional regulator with XRE-family HTH domain
MVIGDRLKGLRESKKLSQGDIEKRTGLLRCYISRVENGYTVPAVDTLEKMAGALEVPMYQLFHEGEVSESVRKLKLPRGNEEWGTMGRTAGYFDKLRKLLGKMDERQRNMLMHMAQKVARHGSKN